MKKLSSNERLSAILKLVNVHQKIDNNTLAKLLKVSVKTIRCDVRQLEQEQLIKRVHGGVTKASHYQAGRYSLDASLMSIVMESSYLHLSPHSNKSTMGLNSMGNKVFVLGSFNVDITSNVDRFPVPGETVSSHSSGYGAGGKGANQAYAAARNGAEVTFMTKIGNDQFNLFAKEHLSKTGINHNIILESETQPTGNALIMVSSENGENMIAVNSGANVHIQPEEVAAAESRIVASDILVTQLETNTDAILAAMRMASGSGVKVVLNPAPFKPEVNQLIPYVDIITPNETEASEIAGVPVETLDDAKNAAKIIHNLGVESVVITRGSKGALVYENGRFTEVPVFNSAVVDTTGAGDSFNGALVSQLGQGRRLEDAAKYASAYASLKVERVGAANMPDSSLVEQRLVSLR
ncbi:ribokinase [Vibrio sp. SCSIO 43137]|uniref:ribokinase n=1 Tax=Vibrio sp. SCSIO 43137 TaxID=3021011 RepID=UPI002307493D|nr:ribokinase [Vibrio sp. SCSIO 43137]WCE30773.1 ribokinase [Vibrio sp. SCSIO 43137]